LTVREECRFLSGFWYPRLVDLEGILEKSNQKRVGGLNSPLSTPVLWAVWTESKINMVT